MNALKNASHAALLALWALAGILFSLSQLAHPLTASLVSVAGFWAWFVGYAALSSGITSKLSSAAAALATHAGLWLVMVWLPVGSPLSLLRFGLDCVRGVIA